MFFVRVLLSFPGNGFNLRTYMQFIVHVTCFTGSRQISPCFVHFVSISVFVVLLDGFCRPCFVCVFEFCFVRVLGFCFVSYVMPVIRFVPVFSVFLKVCFCLSESRLRVVLGWPICFDLLLSVMMFSILLNVLLASFDGFNISNN